MANFQDDGYLSMEDQQRAIAMIGAQDIPDQADLGGASDLQQRERLVEQREQALNARLAQHDQEVNDRIAQRDQEYQQFHAQELRRIEQEAARWAEDQKMQLKTMANEFEHHTLEQAEAYIKERSRQVPTWPSEFTTVVSVRDRPCRRTESPSRPTDPDRWYRPCVARRHEKCS